MTARSFPLRLRKDMDREGGRGGIPSGEESKMQQKKITIRPSEAEYEQIQDLAKRSNKSVNRCLIDAALWAEVREDRRLALMAGALCGLQNILLQSESGETLKKEVARWRTEAFRIIGG